MINLTKKQTQLVKCSSQQILYGGAMAGGKSFAARALAIIYATQISGLQIYLFRKHSQDIINNYFTMAEGDFPDLLKEYTACGFAKITMNPAQIMFKNGSSIKTHHMSDAKALESIQGAEIGLCIIEESTQITEEQIRFIRSRVRMTKSDEMLAEIEALGKKLECDITLPKLLFLTNPGGTSAGFHKKLFIHPSEPETEFIDPESGLTTYYLPARLQDNPHLDQEQYKKQLEGLGDKNLIQAYLDGNWNVMLGGSIFEDVWKPEHIIIEPFKIPKEWPITRAADFGFSPDASAIAYFTESNGENVIRDNGEIVYSRPSDLFLIFEYDTADDNGVGVGIESSKLGKILVEIDSNMPNKIDISNSPLDSQCWAVTNGKSIYDDFEASGCYFTKCIKGPGSRLTGLQIFRDYLSNNESKKGPSLRIFNHCRKIISQLPMIPRSKTDPRDAESSCKESHYYDAIRYRLAVKKHSVKNKSVAGLI